MLPNIKLTNPSLQKFLIKSEQIVEELVPVEKEFLMDGNLIKGFVNEPKLVKKIVDTEVDMVADHISNYEISHDPLSQRLAVRYWHGFINNNVFMPSLKNDSIIFNGAGYKAAGLGKNVSYTEILNAIMKYQKILGTIVS